ncbi:sigma-54 interaction domain-containing protein [Halomonas daqiaonensis]|uniref:DNA-binding transcriptional response regulator, NtrC family, contains REC, AAA-type ATPase, and a Fis-type DNA-binding domains n=1 Tax=Halomonas daqiaonensis TaxID=650850 RepID=A0A1H7M2S4_9GAMM|nr:sigma-54 dependent transcriptional regulator [Halomonas daqiaonensis]SEL05025.1 DNA-binding transcriptional response regulator, NtrC family, contains REC, AAA-type ATPase, and a Fis-type DNA-binding domains [Halomonas daqiaonensis]
MEKDARCWLVDEGTRDPSHLEDLLESLGWEVHRLSPPFSECGELESKGCEVGVVLLEGLSSKQLSQLESLMIKSHCLWLAVASASVMEDADHRRLVATLCHGVVEPESASSDLGCLIKHTAFLSWLQTQDAESRHSAAAMSSDAAEYEMVGTTPAMWKLFQTIRKVAAVDAPIFISGESGTGKELTAQAIHERSPRTSAAFHAINCGALPDHLIQSELFGHEKGAFTGAAQRKIGRIEATNGGTLFLDEIGDLPLELQVNLLRFLETRTIQRVGGLEDIAVDVRIIAATHVDLEKAVEEGRFREDLYHRLNVLQIKVPPLREHKEDIEILARYFFERFSSEKASRLKGFSREALLVMRQYHWPGNIRELINRIRRAMVMCENPLIQPEDLGIERRKISRHSMSLDQARDTAEREALVAALGRNRHKVLPAAQELGVSRVTIYRLMEKHGLSRPEACPTAKS